MNKFENGVGANGGEFKLIETDEEREYLQELFESMICDIEWELMLEDMDDSYFDDDEDESE